MNRALRNPVRDYHVGTVLIDQRARRGQECVDHTLLVVGNGVEIEADRTPSGDPGFHPIQPCLRAMPGNDARVVANHAEPIAELSSDMKHRLAWRDHRYVDKRAAAIDAEI